MTHRLPEHIVHLGAGFCSELDDYLHSGANHITLVEADPVICKQLCQRTKGQSRLKVVNAAVASSAKDETFHVYNFSAASSLREATGLYDIFPGLQLKKELSLATTIIEELLLSLELDSRQPNLLIIDTPGEELPILESIHNSGRLDFFPVIKVYCGTGNFYQESTNASTLLTSLQKWGYDVFHEDRHIDPDRPCWTLRRNPLFLELTAAKGKLGELQQALDDSNKVRDEYEQQIRNLKKLLNDAEEIQVEQRAKIGEREQMLAQLRQELTASIEELEKLNQQQQKLTLELAAVNKTMAGHEHQAQEFKKQLNAATEVHKEQSKTISERGKMLDEFKQRLESIREELNKNKYASRKLRLLVNEETVEKLDEDLFIDAISKGKKPTILVAGMRHCGSTALYNLIRLALNHMGYTLFCGYSEYLSIEEFEKHSEECALIKTHEIRDDFAEKADWVICSIRDIRDTTASAKRREFPILQKLGVIEYAKHNRLLSQSWEPVQDYLFHYEAFIKNPIDEVTRLYQFLGIPVDLVRKVIQEVAELPTDKYKETLLSDTHITDKSGKLTYSDTLSAQEVEQITQHNHSWLELHGYKV